MRVRRCHASCVGCWGSQIDPRTVSEVGISPCNSSTKEVTSGTVDLGRLHRGLDILTGPEKSVDICQLESRNLGWCLHRQAEHRLPCSSGLVHSGFQPANVLVSASGFL